jgi:hypothetical protein
MLANLFVVAVIVTLAAAKPLWHQLGNYSFEQYLSDFKHQYHQSEIGARRALFNAELARVQAHNAKNLSWKEGINKFSAMTGAERKAYFGRSKGHAHNQKLTSAQSLPADFVMKPVEALPANVDWREKCAFNRKLFSNGLRWSNKFDVLYLLLQMSFPPSRTRATAAPAGRSPPPPR